MAETEERFARLPHALQHAVRSKVVDKIAELQAHALLASLEALADADG